jgi:serine/threonine protein kinase, bacterial
VALAFQLQPGAEPFPGFVLHLPLGRGASGEVWEARGPDGAPVALKFIKCKNTTIAAKEVRSFQALKRLYHPNLLPVFDVFLQAEYVVTAMELADGSLMDLLDAFVAENGTAVQPEMACRHLAQAAEAIDFLNSFRHEHEGRRVAFQHCDIKPSNLLLVGDRVKVADFGLACPMAATSEPHARAGTLDFAAPEVYRGRITDRTDQYALAVSYCLLRGGRLPFHNTTGRFTPSYSRGQPDLSMLSSPERAVIAQALSVSSIHRWASCGEMMAQLQNLFGAKPQPFATVALNRR